ncbi:MAG: hypothetical protein UW03_C0002G0060 [Candidatus Peregrinibacteria bacterium GW2011_GWA2_43_8]|nr:MAG: hypothetical protein UW03_C0002G0060 [Candidatus Peregrinibacteria bacterium GW2011_GWA2_43_8]
MQSQHAPEGSRSNLGKTLALMAGLLLSGTANAEEGIQVSPRSLAENCQVPGSMTLATLESTAKTFGMALGTALTVTDEDRQLAQTRARQELETGKADLTGSLGGITRGLKQTKSEIAELKESITMGTPIAAFVNGGEKQTELKRLIGRLDMQEETLYTVQTVDIPLLQTSVNIGDGGIIKYDVQQAFHDLDATCHITCSAEVVRHVLDSRAFPVTSTKPGRTRGDVVDPLVGFIGTKGVREATTLTAQVAQLDLQE